MPFPSDAGFPARLSHLFGTRKLSAVIKFILKHILIPIGFGLILGFLITLFFDWGNLAKWDVVRSQMLYAAILSLFFWKGSELIIRLSYKKHSWIKETRKILIRQIIFSFLYSLSVIFLFYLYIWFVLMHRTNMQGFYTSFRYGFFLCFSITAIMILISYSYNFYKNWKKAIIREEQLKRESLALQYESLKNQLNPHFLFNSLNTLTSLIETDQKASIKYVKQLSEVFRYVLDQNSRELVDFSKELAFIDSYYYLQKIRFGKNFSMEMNIQDKEFLIVPLALQLLVENALKHNEISSENPLKIIFRDEEMYLYISNPIQTRNTIPDSNHIGLKNLSFQYEFLCGETIMITTKDGHFEVKIPKIKRKSYAHTNR